MTDRIKAFVVTLNHFMREDDAEVIAEQIREIAGVADVEGEVAGLADHAQAARERG